MDILPIFRSGVAAVAMLLVGACQGPLEQGTLGNCPSTAILEGPGELTRFKSASANGPTDVLFRTKMMTFSGICDFDAKSIEMDLNITIEAVRGPANSTGKAEFVYFVAILNKDKAVLSHTKFPMVAVFEKQDTRFNFTENIAVDIPRRKDDSTSDYIVYLGFEMTHEELSHNRRRQRLR